MKVLVVLFLIFLTGCDAGHLEPSLPQCQWEFMYEAFWSFVSAATGTSADCLLKIKQSPAGQHVCSLITQSYVIVRCFYYRVQVHIEVWISHFQSTFCTEIDQLKHDLEEILRCLNADFHLQFEELFRKICSKLEELRRNAANYIICLDPVGLKRTVLDTIQELHELLDQCFTHLDTPKHRPCHSHRCHGYWHRRLNSWRKRGFYLKAKLIKKVEARLEQFKEVMIKMVCSFETKITETIHILTNKVIHLGRQCCVRLNIYSSHLQNDLLCLWEKWSACYNYC
ncbi:uncharacterized protein LOC119781106 [Cyprinodon tularosa]|uniref:uncharacterized protein LOC119781106 n=1 Tax=Cyprinodon tularosa TaxID=77115 RepID=UPI0018E254AC|nr:uncharacterized protein LOC119781106 [Cyprinodon tularosa]